MILFFCLLFLFAIVHVSCIGSGVFSTHVLRIFCVVIVCASCIINGIIVLVQLSHMPNVIVVCASRMLVLLILLAFCACPMLLLLFMHCLCYYFCSHTTNHGGVVFLFLLLLFMFHVLVVVFLLLEFYTFFVLLVFHALLMVLLLMFHTHQVLLVLVALCACLLLLLFMHCLCYYCCLHIIGSGVVCASCFLVVLLVACISHIINVVHALCITIATTHTSTFKYLPLDPFYYFIVSNITKCCYYFAFSNCVWCGTSYFLLCASTKAMKVEAPCSTIIKFEVGLFFNIPLVFFYNLCFFFCI